MDDGTEGSEIKFLDNLDIKVDIETLIIDERVDNRYEKTIELSQRRIFEPELDIIEGGESDCDEIDVELEMECYPPEIVIPSPQPLFYNLIDENNMR